MIPIASFYLGANSITPATSGFNPPSIHVPSFLATLPHQPTSKLRKLRQSRFLSLLNATLLSRTHTEHPARFELRA